MDLFIVIKIWICPSSGICMLESFYVQFGKAAMHFLTSPDQAPIIGRLALPPARDAVRSLPAASSKPAKPAVAVELVDKKVAPELHPLLRKVREGLAHNQHPEPVPLGVNGTYFMKDKTGLKVAIFKPVDEEFRGVDSEGAASSGEFGLLPGETAVREAAAYRVALEHPDATFHSVPPTGLVRITAPRSAFRRAAERQPGDLRSSTGAVYRAASAAASPRRGSASAAPAGTRSRSSSLTRSSPSPSLTASSSDVHLYASDYDSDADSVASSLCSSTGSLSAVSACGRVLPRRGSRSPAPPGSPADAPEEYVTKVGSLQAFVDADGDSDEFGPSQFPVDDVHKIGILDLQILNCDRNSQNVLVKQLDDGSLSLVPIDHGFSMPSSLSLGVGRFEWLNYPAARRPFSPAALSYIENISPERLGRVLRDELRVRPECVDMVLVGNRWLKRAAAAGLTLYEIGDAVCRRDLDKPSELETAYSAATPADTHLPSAEALDREMDALIARKLSERRQ